MNKPEITTEIHDGMKPTFGIVADVQMIGDKVTRDITFTYGIHSSTERELTPQQFEDILTSSKDLILNDFIQRIDSVIISMVNEARLRYERTNGAPSEQVITVKGG